MYPACKRKEPGGKFSYSASFFVKKRTIRALVNYRDPNKITKRKNASLPQTDKIMDCTGNVQIFSKTDFRTRLH